MIDFRVHENGLEKWSSGLRGASGALKNLGPVAQRSGQILLPLVRAKAPRKTGRTAARIALVTTGSAATIEGPQILAMLAHGTRPHEIRARNSLALHFQMRGAQVFAVRVWHPGTKPRPFIQEAFNLARMAILREGVTELRKAVDRIKAG